MADPKQNKFMDAVRKDANPQAKDAIGFLQKYAKQITVAVLGIVLIIVVALGYQWYQERKLSQEQSKLGLILSAQQGEARLQALNDFLLQTPAEFKPAVYFEIAFTASGLNKHEQAADAWKSGAALLAPNDPMLVVAVLGEAAALYKGGSPAAGAAVLEEALDKVNLDPNSARFVKMELAALAEAAGQWEKSVAVYEELAAGEPGEGVNFFTFRANEIKAGHSAAPAPAGDETPAGQGE